MLADRTGGVTLASVAAAAVALTLAPEGASAQVLRYATEYPVMAYETAEPTNAVARLVHGLERGQATLRHDGRHGYLPSLLEVLGVPRSSQVLVFSKTSLQSALITAESPRAIYFNDDVYLAWVPGGDAIEIAVMDANLGPVFYTLDNQEPAAPRFRRETVCLECHDTYSLTGGGVPRFLIGSGVTSPRGQTVFHGGWNLTTDRTPLDRRWGGWFVTGRHGSMRHMGNVAVLNAEEAERADLRGGGNLTDLSRLLDTSRYLTGHSDIVALLVLEHQIHVQNLITRANWEARTSLYDNRNVGFGAEEVADRIEAVAQPLAQALLFVGEAPLEAEIAGTSGFREHFESSGPKDPSGRSLRDLRLRGRVFRYPVSYLVHSEAFATLPEAVKARVFARLADALSGIDGSPETAHVRGEAGADALAILRSTHDDFRAWYEANR